MKSKDTLENHDVWRVDGSLFLKTSVFLKRIDWNLYFLAEKMSACTGVRNELHLPFLDIL